MNYEHLWSGPIHQAFIESLSDAQLEALTDLLLVATFADDEFSIEERRALAESLRPSDTLTGLSSLDPKFSAQIETLYTSYEANPDSLLRGIAERLGSDAARRGAFRSAVELTKSDGLVHAEIEFVRHLGEMLGLESEVIEFALRGPQ